ncbi:MAG: bifunctional adenosylcobinamide kinase/adenosylcobinamide-phosphate guanylyltransferase [Candidatus Caldatribacteriaceae bacterium]
MPGPFDRKILLLGGARSGKSRRALAMVEESGLHPVYCATGVAVDTEMEERIARHRKERGERWKTFETPFGFGEVLREDLRGKGVLVDCVTFLLSNFLFREKDGERAFLGAQGELRALFGKQETERFLLVLVSNEVGMGLVPEYPEGRIFRDLQGRMNQWLAEEADEVYFVVAGIPWKVK